MATKKTTIAAEIKVDSSDASQSVGDLKKQLAGVGTATEGSIAQLKELKKQLKNTAAGSEEFQKLFNQIDDLEDKIKGSKKASSDWIDTLESAGGPIGAIGTALNKAKVATTSFSAAIKATGIGLLVTLIGGLAAAFAKNEGALKKLEPIITQFGRILNGILRAMEPIIDGFIDLATRALPYVSKGFEVAYSALSSFLQGIGLVGSAVKKFISGDFAGAWDDAKKSVTEFGKRYEESNQRFIAGTKELTDKEKEEQAKRLQQQKEAAEKREAEALKAQEKEQAALLKSYEEYLKRRDFARKNREGLYKEEIRANNAKDQEDEDKRNEDALNKTLGWQLKSLAGKKSAIIEGLNADKKASDETIKIAENERDVRVSTLQAIANATDALGAVIGNQTKVGRTLGIASALINTYLGASEVIRAKSVLPEPAGTIQKIASVAAIIATGMKSVKAITAVQVPSVKGSSGGSGTPSIPSIGSITAPLSPTLQTTTLNQAQVNQIGNVAARAYVIESDVTGNQERITRLNRAARIN